MGTVRASYPRFRREGEAPRVELTHDDVEIIKTVHRHRFIRAEDLFRLFHLRSPDRLSRRLTILYRAGYLDRPIAQIDRFGQGGSHSMVYGLDNGGARYLKKGYGASVTTSGWKSRNGSYSRWNLDHTLAVSKFLVDLDVACRSQPDVSIITVDEILAAAPEEVRLSRHPLSWTVPIQWHGGKSDVELTPDAMFGLRVKKPNGAVSRSFFFVEIDRGTMTIAPSEEARRHEAFPYRATILRKLYAYGDSFRMKIHERRFGLAAPRVIFATTNAKRASSICKIAQQLVVIPQRLPSQLFEFSGTNAVEDMLKRLCPAP